MKDWIGNAGNVWELLLRRLWLVAVRNASSMYVVEKAFPYVSLNYYYYYWRDLGSKIAGIVTVVS